MVRVINMSKDTRLTLYAIQLLFLAITLLFGLLSVFASLPIAIMIAWINKTIKGDRIKSGRNMLVIQGAIVAALSPGIIIAWGFRIRARYGKFSLPDDLTSELVILQTLEVISLAMIAVIATVTIIRAATSKKEISKLEIRDRTFRQKVRDGDIQSNVDRPIRRSPKR